MERSQEDNNDLFAEYNMMPFLGDNNLNYNHSTGPFAVQYSTTNEQLEGWPQSSIEREHSVYQSSFDDEFGAQTFAQQPNDQQQDFQQYFDDFLLENPQGVGPQGNSLGVNQSSANVSAPYIQDGLQYDLESPNATMPRVQNSSADFSAGNPYGRADPQYDPHNPGALQQSSAGVPASGPADPEEDVFFFLNEDAFQADDQPQNDHEQPSVAGAPFAEPPHSAAIESASQSKPAKGASKGPSSGRASAGRKGKPKPGTWTQDEERIIRDGMAAGRPKSEIAEGLGRSVIAITAKWWRMNGGDPKGKVRSRGGGGGGG